MLKLNIFKAILCFALLQICDVAARPQLNFAALVKRVPTLGLRTNAARMAVGLPPLQPRQLYDATRVQARHDQASPSPSPAPHAGHIKVVKAHDGSLVGWVKQSYDSGVSRFDTTNGADRMTVTFSTSSTSKPFNLAIGGTGSGQPLYLGFAGSDIGGSTKNDLTRTQATPPGSKALPVGNGMTPTKPDSESAVWFYDSTKLTAHWVNSSGPSVDSFFWFVPGKGLYLVGATSGLGDGFEVKFYLD